jgi:2-polyprenyl-3-methyl-5-hydroxy-6-metoxy-1,4-benzoquinol methylase
MSFYHDFSFYYDQIFPVQPQTISCLKELFIPNSRVLDIGCGAGGYAIALSKLGYRLDAIDFDEKMIELAKKKHSSVHFETKDMLEMEAFEWYQGIYCIGNTLVHLSSLAQIRLALANVFDALQSGGQFVLQIINYDRVLDSFVDHLPTIKANDFELIRNYEYTQGKILFNTILKTPEGIFENAVPLVPIRQYELFQMMTEIGFKEVRSYGTFASGPFDIEHSMMLVMKGKKA